FVIDTTRLDGNDTLDGGADTDDLRVSGGGDITADQLANTSNFERLTLVSDLETTVELRDNTLRNSGNVIVDASALAAATSFLLIDAALKTDAAIELIGGGSEDVAFGTSLDDTLAGNADQDALFGNDGNDIIDGGADSDLVDGGAGNDAIAGGAGQDALVGGLGDDTLDGGADLDVVDFTDAGSAVTVDLTAGTASGEGADVLADIEAVLGSAQADDLTANAGSAEGALFGGAGGDTLTGTAGNEGLFGQLGDDSAEGGAGSDFLSGGGGNDTLRAGDGNDDVVGGAGDDLIEGGAGNDLLLGDDPADGGQALGFDGVDDAVFVPNLEGVSGTSDLSFEAWLTPGISADMAVLDMRADQAGFEKGFFFGFVADGQGGLISHARIADGAGNVITLDGSALSLAGTAQHFAVTVDRDGLMSILVDGVVDQTIDISSLDGVDISTTDPLFLGESNLDDAFASYAGAMDEVRLWSVARSDAEIAGARDDLLVGDETGLELYYQFHDLPAPFTADETANGNTGFFVGGPALEASTAVINDVSSGNDTLLGGDGVDTIQGGDGADIIDGGDDLVGGVRQFFDTADFSDQIDDLFVSLEFGAAHNGVELDRIARIERVVGGDGDDVLEGGFEDFFEELVGGAGNDTLDGIRGFTAASYQDDPSGIVASLATGVVTDGFGGTDTLIDIVRVEGSEFGDALTGGDGNDSFRARGGADTIDGGAGFDEVDYNNAGATTGVNVDLNTGTASDGTGSIDVISNVERARGSAFGDTLTGDANDNRFRGMDGADSMVGGDGFDTVDYGSDAGEAGGQSGVNVNLTTERATDGFGETDTIEGFEAVFGTEFGDTITGDANANVLVGGDGLDVLIGGAGDDTLDGGDDNLDGVRQFFDTADYSQDTGAVDINLFTGIGLDGFGDTDTLLNIERVVGSAGNDTLTGGATAFFEEFDGGAGSDLIDGGDALAQDSGFDAASYQNAGAAINATFVAGIGTVTGGDGGTDTLIGIERVEGTEFDDTLIGDENFQTFRARGGNDFIVGGGSLFDDVDYLNSGAFEGANINLATGIATDGTGGTDTL
ncbi:LamG-like jellyroll fold domain-containing protein, partial [Minwuia thermotolerans]